MESKNKWADFHVKQLANFKEKELLKAVFKLSKSDILHALNCDFIVILGQEYEVPERQLCEILLNKSYEIPHELILTKIKPKI